MWDTFLHIVTLLPLYSLGTLTAVRDKSLSCGEILRRADIGTNVLMTMYNESSGLWGDNTTDFQNWWNSANMVSVLLDCVQMLPNHQHIWDPIFSNTFYKAQEYALTEKLDNNGLFILKNTLPTPAIRNGFTRMYFDDDGWWALSWIQAYDIYNETCYLQAGKMIFEHMVAAWSHKCGGGVWWNTEYAYKNAIANELFMNVAVSLANRVNKQERAYYKSWAIREYTWFVNTGLINSDYLINDGLDIDTCQNNRENTWSYNQGVILGAFIEMENLLPDHGIIDLANHIAKAAIRHLTDGDNILHDICEPVCWHDGDSPQFKGIFVRNLQKLDRISPSTRYKQLIIKNAEAVWGSKNRHDEFGDVWTGPPSCANAATHSSGLAAVVASIDALGFAMG